MKMKVLSIAAATTLVFLVTFALVTEDVRAYVLAGAFGIIIIQLAQLAELEMVQEMLRHIILICITASMKGEDEDDISAKEGDEENTPAEGDEG